jgi:hypothetical protein
MDNQTEKRLLQVSVALACIVPISAGLFGIAYGAGFVGRGGDIPLDSHVRYLSGLLLGIGIGFVTVIPSIERKFERASLLSAIVVIGGVGRLYGVLVDGWPGGSMTFALVMELIVVPVLWLWQLRISRRWRPID